MNGRITLSHRRPIHEVTLYARSLRQSFTSCRIAGTVDLHLRQHTACLPGLRDPGASPPGLAVEGRDQRRHRTRAHRSGPGHRVRVLRLCRQRHRRAHGAVVKDASDSSELPREAMERVLNNSVYTLLSRETRTLRGVAAVDWGLRTEDALIYRIGKFRTGGGSRCQLADLAGARRHLTRPRVSLKGTDGYPYCKLIIHAGSHASFWRNRFALMRFGRAQAEAGLRNYFHIY